MLNNGLNNIFFIINRSYDETKPKKIYIFMNKAFKLITVGRK